MEQHPLKTTHTHREETNIITKSTTWNRQKVEITTPSLDLGGNSISSISRRPEEVTSATPTVPTDQHPVHHSIHPHPPPRIHRSHRHPPPHSHSPLRTFRAPPLPLLPRQTPSEPTEGTEATTTNPHEEVLDHSMHPHPHPPPIETDPFSPVSRNGSKREIYPKYNAVWNRIRPSKSGKRSGPSKPS